MLIFSFGEPIPAPCALVLGGFDGLHIGHMRLLSAARKTGLPVAVTTMYGGKGVSLFVREERREIFRRAGVDLLIEIDLSAETMRLTAEEFLRELFSEICARAVFCGEDFRFGFGACGTPAHSGAFASCRVEILPVLEEGGKKVSLSAIKKAVADGDMSANRLLAFPYFVQGAVEHGRQVGRKYGFPTLNLSLPREKLLPREAVYGGYAETPQGRFPAIVNLGSRPTFGVAEKKIEAHLAGFSGDLYGAEVRIFFLEFYREIVAFSSAEELKAQLARDIERAKRYTV